jgi:hypothetical protein
MRLVAIRDRLGNIPGHPGSLGQAPVLDSEDLPAISKKKQEPRVTSSAEHKTGDRISYQGEA